MTSIDDDVDGDDTIVQVNDGFWRLARENDGVLEESAVIGANLFRFVGGPLTAEVYRTLHRFVCGTGMPLRFPNEAVDKREPGRKARRRPMGKAEQPQWVVSIFPSPATQYFGRRGRLSTAS